MGGGKMEALVMGWDHATHAVSCAASKPKPYVDALALAPLPPVTVAPRRRGGEGNRLGERHTAMPKTCISYSRMKDQFPKLKNQKHTSLQWPRLHHFQVMWPALVLATWLLAARK